MSETFLNDNQRLTQPPKLGVLIVFVATMLLLLCPDTPTGKWSNRAAAAESNRRALSVSSQVVDLPSDSTKDEKEGSPTNLSDDEKKIESNDKPMHDKEIEVGGQEMVDHAIGQVIHKPTWKESSKVIFSLQTLVLGAVSPYISRC